eukprot:scaffold123493_cov25-Tisochrysis_lutea.AAC.4
MALYASKKPACRARMSASAQTNRHSKGPKRGCSATKAAASDARASTIAPVAESATNDLASAHLIGLTSHVACPPVCARAAKRSPFLETMSSAPVSNGLCHLALPPSASVSAASFNAEGSAETSGIMLKMWKAERTCRGTAARSRQLHTTTTLRWFVPQ